MEDSNHGADENASGLVPAECRHQKGIESTITRSTEHSSVGAGKTIVAGNGLTMSASESCHAHSAFLLGRSNMGFTAEMCSSATTTNL